MNEPLTFRRVDEAKRGGFFRGERPTIDGKPAGLLIPFGRTRTASDERAFQKRVAKRRARKGYQ